jgi:hypothetical protein
MPFAQNTVEMDENVPVIGQQLPDKNKAFS